MGRDILAVVAGFAVWTVCWLTYNAALRGFGLLPKEDTSPVRSVTPLLSLLIGSLLFSLAAGYVAASVSDSSGYVVVLVLGVVLVGVGAFMQSRVWKLMPVWYHLSFLLLLVPATLAGAWIHLT